MKHLALALMFSLPTVVNATEIEEVTVTASKHVVKIVLAKLADNHEQNPITGNWYYVEKKTSDKA